MEPYLLKRTIRTNDEDFGRKTRSASEKRDDGGTTASCSESRYPSNENNTLIKNQSGPQPQAHCKYDPGLIRTDAIGTDTDHPRSVSARDHGLYRGRDAAARARHPAGAVAPQPRVGRDWIELPGCASLLLPAWSRDGRSPEQGALQRDLSGDASIDPDTTRDRRCRGAHAARPCADGSDRGRPRAGRALRVSASRRPAVFA